MIEIACLRPEIEQAATLAHERQHAAEIAEAPWVVDAPTLAAYYRRIGQETDPSDGGRRFETPAARAIAARVHRELSSAARSSY